jgi:hypothetical protein
MDSLDRIKELNRVYGNIVLLPIGVKVFYRNTGDPLRDAMEATLAARRNGIKPMEQPDVDGIIRALIQSAKSQGSACPENGDGFAPPPDLRDE